MVRARVTAQQLLEMGDDVRRELIDGEVVESLPTNARHGRVTTRTAGALERAVEAAGTGVVLSGDVGFILCLAHDPERVRGPDVAYVSYERLPGGTLPETFLRGAPDIAVEIVSPSDSASEVEQKVADWLDGGARLVWVLAPRPKSATVYRADGSAQFLREHDHLDGEDVLPGLRISLADVFA